MILVGMEIIASIAYTVRYNWNNDQLIESGQRADVYSNQGWAPEYWREEILTRSTVRSDWHSYVYWRRTPYHGNYINIDENGIRYTWNNSSSPSPSKVKLFMFGGSALWGTGARDEYSIPSLVSKKLKSEGEDVWVTNFGENGYVSTQEVITLMLELQKGDVPDVVIFYDGANDMFSAFQQGVAGIPQNEYNRVAEFNQLNWRGGVVEKLSLFRLVNAVVQRVQRTSQVGKTDLALANEVVDVYSANMRIVESLAKSYGFSVVFCWQPVIYDKRELSNWEQQQLNLYTEARFFKQVGQVVNQRALSRIHPGFHNLANAFDDATETVFIDTFHISEGGNERIADLMLQILPPVTPRSKVDRSTSK